MAKDLFESKYVVSELYNLPQIPISEFRIADDIVLKQVNEETCFFINHNKGSIYPGEHEDDFAEKALTYCQLISLVSEFVPKVEMFQRFELMIQTRLAVMSINELYEVV